MKKKKKTKTLRQRYEDICNDYIKAFEKKQERDFEFWTGVGNYASIGDYYIAFDEIMFDIDFDINPNLIFEYYSYIIDNNYTKDINYKHYLCKYQGYSLKELTYEYDKPKKTQIMLEDLKQIFIDAIENYKNKTDY